MSAKRHYTQSSFHQPTLPALETLITKGIRFYKSYNISVQGKKIFKFNLLNAKTRSGFYFFRVQAAQLYSFPTCIVLHPL